MRLLVTPLLALLLAAEPQQGPKFPIGKETTRITGPLDKEGYVDFQAALNDHFGKGITPEKNANVLIWKALGPTPDGGARMPAEYFKRLGIKEPPKDGDYFIGLDAFLKDHLKLDQDKIQAINDQLEWTSERPWTAKDYPQLAAWLKANEKPLALVLEATRRPDYFNPLVAPRTEEESGLLIEARIPSVQMCRQLARALTARAMLRVGEGKYDEAWQNLHASHRLSRLLSRGASVLEGLVGITLERITSQADLAYLEAANLTAKQIQDRLKDLQKLPQMRSLENQMDLTERFTYLEIVQNIRRHGPGILESISGEKNGGRKKRKAGELKAMDKIDWGPALRGGNPYYDRFVAILRLNKRTVREKELDKFGEDLKMLKGKTWTPAILAKLAQSKELDKEVGVVISEVLLGLLLPATRKVQNAHDRSEQVQRNLHIAFALAAYQRDHGKYPPKLDELAPKYLVAVPIDLFSGRALVYRPAEKGYLFYSVGVNGQDEGGRLFYEEPIGSDDLPVRMPLPKLKPPQ